MIPRGKTTTTIAAPATPPGRGGIGVIRLSGPKTAHIAQGILGALPPPRYATYKPFRDALGDPIDTGLALYFPAPHSFTGEDVLELHGHGGPVVMDLLLARTLELGAEPARPGEFSQRAFLNGKLDLVQVEAIADLIDSASEQAARAARQSLQGVFSQAIHGLLESLLQLRTRIEAAIDFPDDDIDFLSASDTGARLAAIGEDLHRTLDAARRGSLLREGARIVIAGRPNVGKSSLLNALAGRDTAIVTDIPGTTRDVLQEHIHLDGHPLHIFDTAGLRETRDPVERHGVQRARDAIGQAHILLLVVDEKGIQPEDQRVLARFQSPSSRQGMPGPNARDSEQPLPPVTLIVQNKIDLIHAPPQTLATDLGIRINLSAKTGAGLDLLGTQLKTRTGFQQNTEGLFLARRRHLDALERARLALDSARRQLTAGAAELLAEDLRQAQQALGEITGQYTTENLLDRIFSSFCIGK
uniref:tRNA modification GTPase MnmE n=1 Tax=Candidatus Kentrum eta TaxID=2126337 RepID=A0A450USJ3_9GAMM|nr:MAG: tRNA modification GTPase trmE [Candidatus Kentron sp. H]VFJ96352.1 MAG: tRNA modification GTPase trmE [Candidatus Kentron sp. H]VFK02239.1 MAG: tRNA modification GTPase trmE [Candidatus Kentron sp. H]